MMDRFQGAAAKRGIVSLVATLYAESISGPFWRFATVRFR
jgi:hypothetical protein